MPTIHSFTEALGLSSDGIRHLLLGNGFSIACRPDIFQYGKLFEQADFQGRERVQNVFGGLGTTDFERVIRVLRDFSAVAPFYYPRDASGHQAASGDAAALREMLVRAIATSHPARPGDLKPDEYHAAKTFLSHFDRIFALNYDLLLYWTLMQSEIEPDVRCDDGFRKPEDDPESSYVTWEPDNSYEQNVYYLHGALHLFDSGPELQKYSWIGAGIPLIDQIRAALEENKFPVFVSEGTSDEKLTRINHSAYLSKARRALLSIGGGKTASSLFIHGHSLAENDEHIIQAIEHSKISRLFVSLHGAPDIPGNKVIIARAGKMSANRPARHPLALHYYDAASADVWGH